MPFHGQAVAVRCMDLCAARRGSCGMKLRAGEAGEEHPGGAKASRVGSSLCPGLSLSRSPVVGYQPEGGAPLCDLDVSDAWPSCILAACAAHPLSFT